MPCPACGESAEGTEWKADPLRWDLDPPCSEAEWRYLADAPQAPEFMERQACAYMNNICRGCYNARLQVASRVRSRIRQQGGVENLKPTQRMQKEYEEAHASDVVRGRPARIAGLQSAGGAALNGQLCKLLGKDDETQRWTVQFLCGEQKSVKESNLEVSREIDAEFERAFAEKKLNERRRPPGTPHSPGEEEAPRPLGQKTVWPKVKGIHPGAVVRLQGLHAAPELNGRKGRCISFDPETGRWKVDLGDEQKALKVDNLLPATGEKPPTRQSAAAEKEELLAKLRLTSERTPQEVFAENYGWTS